MLKSLNISCLDDSLLGINKLDMHVLTLLHSWFSAKLMIRTLCIFFSASDTFSYILKIAAS